MGLRAALGAFLMMVPAMAGADTVRVATFSPDLSRKGPGLLLRDIAAGKDPQIAAAIAVIVETRPDVLLLTGFDWDHDGLALSAFADRLREAGVDYPHLFAPQPNSGVATGIDMDGDGRTASGADTQGFGRFTGQDGMALLSRHPFGRAVDHSAFLWRDLPGNLIGDALTPEVAAIQRLSSTAHWDVQVMIGQKPLHILGFSATPPVFDGPEDRNGRRNHDEIVFWLTHFPDAPFVLAGNANLDPLDSDGRLEAIRELLASPRLQDPLPASPGGPAAGQSGSNAVHRGDPALDTADWPDLDGPGNLRVDYVLPSADLDVEDAGVFWPGPGNPMAETAAAASRHRLVWVDIDLPF